MKGSSQKRGSFLGHQPARSCRENRYLKGRLRFHSDGKVLLALWRSSVTIMRNFTKGSRVELLRELFFCDKKNIWIFKTKSCFIHSGTIGYYLTISWNKLTKTCNSVNIMNERHGRIYILCIVNDLSITFSDV